MRFVMARVFPSRTGENQDRAFYVVAASRCPEFNSSRRVMNGERAC